MPRHDSIKTVQASPADLLREIGKRIRCYYDEPHYCSHCHNDVALTDREEAAMDAGAAAYEIVQQLAEIDHPMITLVDGQQTCFFCCRLAVEHDPTCVWHAARRLLGDQP